MTTTMYMPCALCAAHTPQRKGDDTEALLDMRPIGGEGIVQLEPGSGWCDPMRCWRTETDAPDPDPDCTWEAREAQG